MTVVTPGGTSVTSSNDDFNYAAAPTVASVSPAAGPLTGSTAVTITGTGFTGATSVDFGLTAATNVVVVSATEITAKSPAGTGTVNVMVVTPGGTSVTSSNDDFRYISVPTVASVSPAAGSMTGGTLVTITGTGFSGATAVDFGATAATGVVVVSASEITAKSPAGIGTVDVTVVSAGGTSTTWSNDDFRYAAAPTVASVSPAVGPLAGGTAVTITGTGFTGATVVDFGATAATRVEILSATEIIAASPTGSGIVNVTVVGPGGTSATSSNDDFTYAAAPTVASVIPAAGSVAGGAVVTITGTGFTGATSVDFGLTAATNVQVISATEITATSPAGAGTVNVLVVTPGGISTTSSSDDFTYA
jgi:hypothetical protein